MDAQRNRCPAVAEAIHPRRIAEVPEDREALEHIARALKGRVLRPPELVAANEPGSEMDALVLGAAGLKSLLEAMPAAIAVLSEGALVYANAAFAYAFGYRSCEELKAAGGLEAVLPGSAQILKALPAGGRSDPLDALTRSRRRLKVRVGIDRIDADQNLQTLRILDQDAVEPEPVAGEPLAIEKAEETLADETPAEETPSGRDPQTSKLDFLAKVSHEVRTPLNSIIGFTELMLQERLGPIGNSRYKGYVEDIHQSGLYALSLLNDLLDISKIEAGKFELDFTAVDAPEIILECVNSLQPLAQRERIVLRTSLAPNLPAVIADPRRLKQILLNLLSNAIKFTNAGGQVIVSASIADGEIRLRVRDNGVGMSADEIAYAMQPFHQLDTAPRRQQGTGLGLPVTKALVDANRARLILTSEPGVGTSADVIFPPDRLAQANSL